MQTPGTNRELSDDFFFELPLYDHTIIFSLAWSGDTETQP